MHAALLDEDNMAAATNAQPRAGVTGWLDLDQFDGRAEIGSGRTDASETQLTGRGFRATVEAAGDWHVTDHAVVLLLGRPLHAGQHVGAAEVSAIARSNHEGALPLGGRYAAVVVDCERRCVRLQTDRFGVWPLCWSREGQRLAFASRADAVPLETAAEIDPQALFDYVYFHMIPAPRTVFRGVSRLESATHLCFSRSGVSTQAAWQPHFSLHRQGELTALRARFRAALRNGVEAETADASSMGCFLSGGTDSSTVAGTLKQTTGRAATFSIGFDAEGYDEMAYARIAARHFDTEHHEHYVTPAELVAAIPSVAAHYDQPFGNSSAVPAYICARLAREHGVKKLLAGDGGDELFGGNTRYAKQKIFEAWWRLPEAIRAGVSPLVANPATRALPLAKKAASYVDQASVPMPARMETYNLMTRFGPTQVFTPEFLQSVNPGEPELLQAEIYRRHLKAPFVDRMLAYDWRFTLADNDLPKVCGTTRLADVDVGFPLLDDALVDVSTLLGPQDKVRGLRLRQFFKESLADFLPPEIIAKKKHGFGLPVGAWLVRDTAFRELARSSLAGLAARRLVRSSLVEDLFSQRLVEHAGYFGEMIWVLMMLEQWLAARHPGWSQK